jgi:hypothetical protein
MRRRILVNYARGCAAGKRGGKSERVSLSEVDRSPQMKDRDLIALDDERNQLETMDPRWVKGR